VCRVSLSVCAASLHIILCLSPSVSLVLYTSLALLLSRWPTLVLPTGPTISTKVGVNDLHRCPNDTKVRPTAQPPQWQHSPGIKCSHSRCVQTWRATGSATQFRSVTRLISGKRWLRACFNFRNFCARAVQTTGAYKAGPRLFSTMHFTPKNPTDQVRKRAFFAIYI
jgi:hypothetical protein